MKQSWWQEGVQFSCQGSGKCCTSHGEYGFVFLTKKDRQLIAEKLAIPTAQFTREYCEKYHGAYHLKEDPKNPDCLFLKDKRCQIYEARPTQCRTWPFWPEVMSPKAWKKEIISFCPGVSKGKVVSAVEIQKRLDEQTETENQILKESRRNSSH